MFEVEFYNGTEFGMMSPTHAAVRVKGLDWRPTRLAKNYFAEDVSLVTGDCKIVLATYGMIAGLNRLGFAICVFDPRSNKMFVSQLKAGTPKKILSFDGHVARVQLEASQEGGTPSQCEVTVDTEQDPWDGIHRNQVEFTLPFQLKDQRPMTVSAVRFNHCDWRPIELAGVLFCDNLNVYDGPDRVALAEYVPTGDTEASVVTVVDFAAKKVLRSAKILGWPYYIKFLAPNEVSISYSTPEGAVSGEVHRLK